MKQITGHQYATLQEQTYAIAAMGVMQRLTGVPPTQLGSNDSTEWVLQLAAEAHSEIHRLLGLYLKPAQIEALHLTGSVYGDAPWAVLADGRMKDIIANPLLLLEHRVESPLAEVLYRMGYGALHPMVIGSGEDSWLFRYTKEMPLIGEHDHSTVSSHITPEYLITFGEGDLEKRGTVEVRLGNNQSDSLRIERRVGYVWYGLMRKHPIASRFVDVPLGDLFSAILSLGFVGTACPFTTTRWECNYDASIPAGHGVLIPLDQVNCYGALILS